MGDVDNVVVDGIGLLDRSDEDVLTGLVECPHST
jgi:hypothetical protein